MKTQTLMKNDFFLFMENLGLGWKFFINGLIGGVIWSLYKKSKIIEAVRQIIIGGVVAGYFTPVIVSHTSMGMETVGFTSFVIGMTGMVVVDSIYKYVVKMVKKWKEAMIIINKTDNKDEG